MSTQFICVCVCLLECVCVQLAWKDKLSACRSKQPIIFYVTKKTHERMHTPCSSSLNSGNRVNSRRTSFWHFARKVNILSLSLVCRALKSLSLSYSSNTPGSMATAECVHYDQTLPSQPGPCYNRDWSYLLFQTLERASLGTCSCS